MKIDINVEYNIGEGEGRFDAIDNEIQSKLEEAFGYVHQLGKGIFMGSRVREIQFKADIDH